MLLLFDGECGVCTRLVRWLQTRLPPGYLEAVPFQRPGAPERLGVTRADAERTVWLLDEAGRRSYGAEAINRLFAEVGGGWVLVSRVYGLPGMGPLEEGVYRWFSQHRHRFARWGDTPACKDPEVRCGDPTSRH